MRCIVFEGEIHRSSIEGLLTVLRRADAPRCVFVSSPGGTFDHFSTLGPAIERQGITTLSGDVRSAAVLLSLLGHTRQAFPGSTFFFHEVRALVNRSGGVTVADLEAVEEYEREMSGEQREFYQEWRRQMKVAQNWFLAFLREKTGLPTSTFLSLMRSEATLSAREALRYGIVHQIVPPENF